MIIYIGLYWDHVSITLAYTGPHDGAQDQENASMSLGPFPLQRVGSGNEISVNYSRHTSQNTLTSYCTPINTATSSLKLIYKTSVLHIPLRVRVDSLAGTVKLVDMETFMLVSCTMYSFRMPLWSAGGTIIQDTDAVVLESVVND